ncbi:MAG: hypothetical protein LZF61_00795 [Nitrosomonas sp.]|nr:MAG: hypothetical protein LZF61_00795 [Nitrosomonas sp.]
MIRYKKRRHYKYTLHETYQHRTDIRPSHPISTRFIDLDTTGLLTIKKNYAWDGASGPVLDTRKIMRSSLVHDALYQLMREQHLSQQARAQTDWLLREICLEDGMMRFNADLVYLAVDIFGARNTKPDLHQAP